MSKEKAIEKIQYAKNPEYEYWINVNEIIDLLKKKI